MKTITRAIAAAVLLAAPPVAAQDLRPCGEEGRGSVVPDLGFANVSCRNCSIQLRTGESITYRFSSEPALHGITGPGRDRLREGDVLVAVDGERVTTDAGARRLGSARRGETVRLTVRREGREREVSVTAGERCMQAPRAPKPPAPPHPPRMHAQATP
ncbi:MAG TPA: PDZ domain-containing protein, partial [Longimicrobium sp.]|nr:PDZ domain-containing protein [Longimicrobium sp.]